MPETTTISKQDTKSKIITLGHGSGGELTNKLLEKGVFKILDNPYLNQHHDGAYLKLYGRYAFTTDSFVVSPIEFPGGNIGDLAVNGTVNDLAMCGARPEFISLAFIIEEGLPMDTLKHIIKSIDKAAKAACTVVVTGDTKVVDRGKGDKIFINTTGIGNVHEKASIDLKHVKAGDKIIVSGELANHGIAIMSQREGLEFDTPVESDTRPLHLLTWNLISTFGNKIKLFRDPTRGGVATVLNEIALNSKTGINILEDQLPVNPITAGACEMLGLDPLFVANEGIFIAIVDHKIADDCLELIKKDPFGGDAKIIGEIVDGHPGKVIEQTSIGGQRVVPMLAGEQLPRIC